MSTFEALCGLTSQSVSMVVRSAIQKTGADISRVSSQILRAGFVKQAAMTGLSGYEIHEAMNHKS